MFDNWRINNFETKKNLKSEKEVTRIPTLKNCLHIIIGKIEANKVFCIKNGVIRQSKNRFLLHPLTIQCSPLTSDCSELVLSGCTRLYLFKIGSFGLNIGLKLY